MHAYQVATKLVITISSPGNHLFNEMSESPTWHLNMSCFVGPIVFSFETFSISAKNYIVIVLFFLQPVDW